MGYNNNMKLTKRERQLYEWAVDFYKHEGQKIDAAHKLDHIKRVLYWACRIQRKEGGDVRILIPAVLLHDIGQAYDNSPNEINHAKLSAEKAPEILQSLGYNEQEVLKICETIELHSTRYTSVKEMTLEGRVIFDADKIDATDVTVLLRTAKKHIEKSHRQIAEEIYKFIARFKSLVGKTIFYTEEGQRIGLRRAIITEKLLKRIIREEDQMDKFFHKIF